MTLPFVRFLRLALVLTYALHAADLSDRIRRIENGLIPTDAEKQKPVRKATLTARMKHYKVPGVSLAVITGGRLEWARGYGTTSAIKGAPVAPDTIFQAASISKPVAAMMAMRLVEQGKLDLDEDVNLKLRSWRVPENEYTKEEKVTLRRLLSHTAGLTVHGFPGYGSASANALPSLIDILDGRKPVNTDPIRVEAVPGTRWSYSGGGYEVMQQLLLDVTGKPFHELAKELVLRPLGMKSSTYEQPLPPARAARAATGHHKNGEPVPGRWHTYPEMAAAGLWTTPTDLAKVLLEMQKGGELLQRSSVRLMLTRVLGEYGLGFTLRRREASNVFGHGGSNDGFKCMMIAFVDGDSGVVIMTNGDLGQALASELTRAIATEYNWPADPIGD